MTKHENKLRYHKMLRYLIVQDKKINPIIGEGVKLFTLFQECNL